MKRIGRYAIAGLLGTGGMSRVYKVLIPHIEKPAALKRLAPHPLIANLMGETAVGRLFEREARTLASLRHPNIVEVWDYDAHQGRPFYLMDYSDSNLADLMGESPHPEAPSRALPVLRAAHYLKQILCGLKRLHHAGIVHRDIKPFNLLITDHDTIKICDFGLSLRRGERLDVPRQLKIGSPWYAAPEQEEHPDAVDLRADLYSAGVVMHRMLTGSLTEDTPEPASASHPDLDTDWDRFLATAMAPSPQDRYASARAMGEELDARVRRWQQGREGDCSVAAPPAPEGASAPVRNRGAKVALSAATTVFPIDDLFRPRAYRTRPLIEAQRRTLFDPETGLHWQQDGSPFPLTRQQAEAYVAQINHGCAPGCGPWRLPTVDELLTLLRPPAEPEAPCIEPSFDATQRTLWSCDRCTFTADWYVSADLGFVGRKDKTGFNFVRAVSDRPAAGGPP